MPVSQQLLPIPEQSEKTYAGLIHISSIFAPLWGPALGWLILHKRSRFAAAHAVTALVEELVLKALLFIALAISTVYSVTRFVATWNAKAPEATFWDVTVQFFSESWLRMLIGFLVVLILGVIMTIVSVVQAKRAFGGEWPKREIRKAQKALQSSTPSG